MSDILWFRDISKDDVAIVGGKSANLGEMAKMNLPVPPGFVITAQAYVRFLKESEIDNLIYNMLDGLDVDNSDKLHEVAEQIQEMIIDSEISDKLKNQIIEAYNNLNVNIDVFKNVSKDALSIIKAGRDSPFVAVRSSATAEDQPNFSFAGQQATFLNVKGNNELIKSVKKCWASLFTGRSIYYRTKNNINHRNVFIAVIVQKMVDAKKSGVIFTVNPATNEEEIVIEAGFGLGETVVSGAITPDYYAVNKENFEIKKIKVNKQDWMIIIDTNLGRNIKRKLNEEDSIKQKLENIEIKKLARYAKQIEEHYKIPQDIEFAIDNSGIYIVQTRPVTTLKKIQKEEIMEEGKELILEGLAASPHVGTGPVKIIYNASELGKIERGDILVTKMTNPDYVVAMKKVAGIVTDEGGLTAHASIVSREMGIACVVGTGKATQILKEKDIITVDGIHGKIYRGDIAIKEEKEEDIKEENIETVTEIKVLVDMPELAEKAAETNADGVGLLRSEFMILNKGEHPVYLIENNRKDELINNLYMDLKQIASAFKGKPVWYRTLDAPTDEFRNLKGGENEPEEDNPMLGWRSIRRSLDQPELLKAEFEAIKKVHDSGLTNVGVMLPLVTDVEQIKKAKEILKEVGLEPLEEIEFGVMIETPASVQIIKEICEEGVDFVSFGTNDLTQFTLAVDRNNAKVQKLYNEMHPAVLRQIKHVINICREYGVETSICGQAGSNEEMAEFLVKAGIDSISANIDAVKKIKRIVAKVERKLLLNVARKEFNE